MMLVRRLAIAVLATMFAAALLADRLAPASYEKQFRESPNAPPSREFPLGTDDLGRDRLSRLLHGSRVSLLLAPAAALLATATAALLGALAGYAGGLLERLAMAATDLTLSLPWLFLLLIVRAMLPLNVSPLESVSITFLVLGCLGWAGPARVVRASVRALKNAEFVLQARATGASGLRLVGVHLLPNLRPVLLAQFWISIPVFIVSEANLGLLGLGVAEPLPSWGNLLRELENFHAVAANPWMLAPAVMLVVAVGCFQLVLSQEVASS
jgi:ABC-type dipeptide/oligopeptide/nickel transport system permease subunit